MPPSDAHPPRDFDEPGGPRPPDPRRALGRLGEDFAVAHLARRGFAILHRNARTRHGEIDIVAFDGNALVFVEVKTRRVNTSAARAGVVPASSHGSDPTSDTSSSTIAEPTAVLASLPAPLEGLHRRQRLRLRRLATAWLQDHPRAPCANELRFDAIGVLVDEQDRLLRLDHVERAW